MGLWTWTRRWNIRNCDSAAQHDVNRLSYKLGGHHVLWMNVTPIVQSTTPPTMALHQPSKGYNQRTNENTGKNQPEDIWRLWLPENPFVKPITCKHVLLLSVQPGENCSPPSAPPVVLHLFQSSCLWLKFKVLHCVSPVSARKQKAAVATEAKLADTPQTKHIPAFIPEGITLNRNRHPPSLTSGPFYLNTTPMCPRVSLVSTLKWKR